MPFLLPLFTYGKDFGGIYISMPSAFTISTQVYTLNLGFVQYYQKLPTLTEYGLHFQLKFILIQGVYIVDKQKKSQDFIFFHFFFKVEP